MADAEPDKPKPKYVRKTPVMSDADYALLLAILNAADANKAVLNEWQQRFLVAFVESVKARGRRAFSPSPSQWVKLSDIGYKFMVPGCKPDFEDDAASSEEDDD